MSEQPDPDDGLGPDGLPIEPVKRTWWEELSPRPEEEHGWMSDE